MCYLRERPPLCFEISPRQSRKGGYDEVRAVMRNSGYFMNDLKLESMIVLFGLIILIAYRNKGWFLAGLIYEIRLKYGPYFKTSLPGRPKGADALLTAWFIPFSVS